MSQARKRTHYAWVIAFCAFFTLFITNGLVLGAGLSVFDETLLESFGWSRATLKFRDFVTLAVAGVAGPFAGALADRYGVRVMVLAGTVLLAGGMFAWSLVGTAGHMYLIHAMFGLALASAGLVVNVLLVSRWFVKSRGAAIGIALVGTSLGSTVFPLVNAKLLASGSWQDAFRVLAVVPLLLLPLLAFVVREHPSDTGLRPYGADADADADKAASAAPSASAGMDYGEAIRTRAFWTLALAAMMTFYAILGAASHLFLHLRSLGFDRDGAAQGLAMMFLMGLVGKFAFGMVSDHVQPKRIFLLGMGMMFVGSLCLASMSPSLLWPFVIAFGLGWGGLYTMLQLMVVNTFGLKAAGRILGTITVLDAIGGGLGPWLTGALFDRTGDYQAAFLLMSAMIFLSMLAASTLKTSAGSASPRPQTT